MLPVDEPHLGVPGLLVAEVEGPGLGAAGSGRRRRILDLVLELVRQGRLNKQTKTMQDHKITKRKNKV